MTDTTTETTTVELTGKELIDAKAKESFDSTYDSFEKFGRFIKEMQSQLDSFKNYRDSFFDDDGLTEVTWGTSGIASDLQNFMAEFASHAASESLRHNRSINITRDHETRIALNRQRNQQQEG